MFRSITPGRKSAFLAVTCLFLFLAVNLPTASSADSGCITCHLDQEMLKKNITVAKGQKSAMQSGAG